MDTMQDIMFRLGEIKSAVEAVGKRQEELTKWMNGMDTRLRAVEIKSALWGIGGSGVGGVVLYFIQK